MSEANALEALQAFHRELVALSEHRLEGLQLLEEGLAVHAPQFKKLVDKPPRKAESRKAVESGKITLGDEEYSVNKQFQENTLQLADELDLDELHTARLLLDSDNDVITLGRSLLECGLIRFHQQRKYLFDCMRLCMQLSDDEDLDPDLQAIFGEYVAKNIYGVPEPGQPAPPRDKKIVPRCIAALQEIRTWLQKLTDRATAMSILQDRQAAPEIREMFEFSRMSLVQQHEGLALILCGAIEKRHVEVADFEDFLKRLQRMDRYDILLVHLFPVAAAYIRQMGSPDGICDLGQARRLNELVSKREDDTWQIPSLRAALCAWWIAEYAGWYMDDVDVPLDNIDLDGEDKARSDAFNECLKDGALDFLLAVASDVETKAWQDPTSSGVQMWIHRACPALPTDLGTFSDFFRLRVLEQLENFVDAFISNLPDVIRQLRVEEDEQRQLSQAHEQSLELERFLLIISRAFEGRPEAAEVFWSDPESNLAGFMQWASNRASTPLVSAFCEMLRSISGNEVSADAAHNFLLDEANSSVTTTTATTTATGTGRIRKSQSLTWTQVVRELDFFTGRIRAHTSPAPTLMYRAVAAAKPPDDQEESEPESAIMLECYLRLIGRICSNSAEARTWLLQNKEFSIVGTLFQLASLPVPGGLRACICTALQSLLSDKTLDVGYIMWNCVEDYMAGAYVQHAQPSTMVVSLTGPTATTTPAHYMDGFFSELSQGFEQPYAFIRFLLTLVLPATDQSPLNDALPFPENLGSSTRTPGMEPYVDFVLDTVFGRQTKEGSSNKNSGNNKDSNHTKNSNSSSNSKNQEQQALRLACLDFAMACLETFNEDLLLIANDTALAVDSAIAATDLATYVKLHPFARTMEWMYNHNVVEAIFRTIHVDSAEIGSASPDSPLILGIIRAVELVAKILDLQDTYLDLVRQVIRGAVGSGAQKNGSDNTNANNNSPWQRKAVSTAYSSFEEAIANHLDLVVDLGSCCGLGHPSLTLVCLKLLEKISTSPRVMSEWNPGPGRHSHQNKAIVALEKDNEAEAIAGSFISEMLAPLDQGLEAAAANYSIKTYMLDFLYACLQASPNQPTIAHLLLGFRCGGLAGLSVEPKGAFANRTSLFHNLVRVLLELPFGDDDLGMRGWLILLKHKIMRIFQTLWRSSLSAPIVLSELRENEIAFHLLIREVILSPELPWDGRLTTDPAFPTTKASIAFIDFWAVRAMTLEYVGIELCSIAQNRLPSLKRSIFDALNGRVVDENGDIMGAPSVFDLYEFLSSSNVGGAGVGDGATAAQWDIQPPMFEYLRGVELRAAMERPEGGVGDSGPALYNLDKAREIVLLKSAELVKNTALVAGRASADDVRDDVQREEVLLLEYLSYLNRQTQLALHQQAVLCAWTKLLLVMFETNEFSGAARVSFFLQALQAILPGLETASTDQPEQALELAKLAEALLSKLHGGSKGSENEQQNQMSSLVRDKLFQLFQICLFAVCKWIDSADLRVVYYNICYRYVSSLVDASGSSPSNDDDNAALRKANKAVHLCGERLLNVVCDDAYGSDATCQTAALVLLGGLVRLGAHDVPDASVSTVSAHDVQVVAHLHRLNFLGVTVDSLKSSLHDSLAAVQAGRRDVQRVQDAKLALLLQVCQSREGAEYVLHANLFRAIELSGLFAADPELSSNSLSTSSTSLTQHYALLVAVARVVAAAVVSRGAHNILQARRFLTQHRMLVSHVLKRSAGIGPASSQALGAMVADLAEAFMVLIVATDFLEFEDQVPEQPQKNPTRVLFH